VLRTRTLNARCREDCSAAAEGTGAGGIDEAIEGIGNAKYRGWKYANLLKSLAPSPGIESFRDLVAIGYSTRSLPVNTGVRGISNANG
jgi:hypothetical protein